jgi:lysyl-tRNA synthetase class 2
VSASVSPWWARHVHADRRPFLEARGRIREAARRYFAEEGFTEVECGALQVSPGNEAHLHAFATDRIRPDARKERLYLHTSPEFACKKLLAAGERKIFSLGPVYRNREQGALHAPEFTMLEWYRVDETYDAIVEDCLRLTRLAAEAGGASPFRFRGREADPCAEAERLTVADAFRRYADIDLCATLSAEGVGDRGALVAEARHARVKTASDDTWADIFSRVLVEKIEPRLGVGWPTILEAYPRCEAALARTSVRDARLADRFELYLCGVEIANGFAELTDAAEQRARFEAEMAEKERVYGERYPLDEDFLAALAEMPPASGVALGFDRLVMLASGAEHINQVIWTPMRRE